MLDAAGGAATTLDGKILRSDSALVLGGTMVSRMHVEKTGEGRFSYTGMSKGKKLEGTFASRAPLTTELASAGKLKALAAGKAAEVRYLTFDDETGGLSEVVFKRDKSGITKTTAKPGSKPGAGGESKRAVQIDDLGLVRSESGGNTSTERLFLRGTPL
jgi:hypothetical protein